MVRGLQIGQILSIEVLDGRPLAKAILILEQRHGWIVTYEDARYEHESDLQDVTAEVRRNYAPDKPKIIAPRGGLVSFSYDLPGRGTSSDVLAVLQTMLSVHENSGNGGIFRVEQDADVFHIVPVAVKDRTGQIVERRSILEVPITLPEAERTVFETLKAVLEVVKRASGSEVNAVNIGSIPLNLFFQTRTREGFIGVPAHDVLLRTFAATGRRLSWRLLYEPGRREYAFNVREVTSPVSR